MRNNNFIIATVYFIYDFGDDDSVWFSIIVWAFSMKIPGYY